MTKINSIAQTRPKWETGGN